MYRLLASETHVCSTTLSGDSDPGRMGFKRAGLLTRIEEVCTGHLRWCFNEEEFLARKSWPYVKAEADEPIPTTSPNPKSFTGSLHVIKLFEYATVFETKKNFIQECLLRTYKIWMKALVDGRDEKSRLWFQDIKKAYIVWDGHRDEGSGWLELPDYRLGDLIYLWKALKCLEDLAAILEGKETFSAITKALKDSAVEPVHVRKLILERFVYQPKATNAAAVTNIRLDAGKPGPDSSNPFAVAVRKSRDRSRLLFYAKDTMLYDGLEWGFFDNDLHLEVQSNSNESYKVDIMSSWQNTVQAQGMDQELIWNKSLRYALAILMAKHGQSMDRTMSAAEAETRSWERLSRCVMVHGLFTYKISRDTKLVKWLDLSESQRSPWEIPTIILRRRYRELVFQMYVIRVALVCLQQTNSKPFR